MLICVCVCMCVCMCVCVCVCVCVQSCPSLCDPMDCNLPGFSVLGISQARILEWIAISYSRGLTRPRDQSHISCLAGRFFTTEPLGKSTYIYICLYIYFSDSFSIIGYCKLLNIVPCAVQWVLLLFIYFIHSIC